LTPIWAKWYLTITAAVNAVPPPGSGDVVGPGSSTDGHVSVFDGITGKLIKDGGALGSAAFTASSAYDAAGAASTVQGNLTTHIGNTGTAVHGLGTASTHAVGDFDSAGAADAKVASVSGTPPITSSGSTTPNISISDFVASGSSHARGAVPDPGVTTGTTKFLREDATWQVVVSLDILQAQIFT
jgi:hypothetical protein